MKEICILTNNQAGTLRDIQNKWECELELLRSELEKVKIGGNHKIEEISDRMESLNRVMENILVGE